MQALCSQQSGFGIILNLLLLHMKFITVYVKVSNGKSFVDYRVKEDSEYKFHSGSFDTLHMQMCSISFVVDPLRLYICRCVVEVSEEKCHSSMVIYEIFETFYVYGIVLTSLSYLKCRSICKQRGLIIDQPLMKSRNIIMSIIGFTSEKVQLTNSSESSYCSYQITQVL